MRASGDYPTASRKLSAGWPFPPAFGAVVFVLIVLGNMVLMGLLFLLLSGTRFPRWLRGKPGRVATVTSAALLVGGTFTFAYWDIRVPAGLGFGWFPMMPWH